MPPDPHSAHHAFDAQLAHPTKYIVTKYDKYSNNVMVSLVL